MKYVALLRGINVGGNNIIKMAALKTAFEKCGYQNVITYIQSGNVIFESPEKNGEKITKKIEADLSKIFNYNSRVVIRSHDQLKKVIDSLPADWNKRTDLRFYIAFIKEPMTPNETLKEIDQKEGVDFVTAGPGVLYMATLLSALTKSGLNKMASKKIYQSMTIRNLNTTKKLLALMEVIL